MGGNFLLIKVMVQFDYYYFIIIIIIILLLLLLLFIHFVCLGGGGAFIENRNFELFPIPFRTSWEYSHTFMEDSLARQNV